MKSKLKKIPNIAKGTAKLLLGINEQLKNNRMKICRDCPIAKTPKGRFTNWCIESQGGCGCYLPTKTSEETESCPYGAWSETTIDIDKVPKTINPLVYTEGIIHAMKNQPFHKTASVQDMTEVINNLNKKNHDRKK